MSLLNCCENPVSVCLVIFQVTNQDIQVNVNAMTILMAVSMNGCYQSEANHIGVCEKSKERDCVCLSTLLILRRSYENSLMLDSLLLCPTDTLSYKVPSTGVNRYSLLVSIVKRPISHPSLCSSFR